MHKINKCQAFHKKHGLKRLSEDENEFKESQI